MITVRGSHCPGPGQDCMRVWADRAACTYINICIHMLCVYIYIYIYIHEPTNWNRSARLYQLFLIRHAHYLEWKSAPKSSADHLW